VEFRILGPLEVVEDGNPVALGTLKERLVLAVLLLHANEFVSRERLIDDLWGEAPPPTAREAVYVYVSKLRKTLTHEGHDPIATASGGYRLHIEPESLDLSRMQVLVGDARELVAEGETEKAAARFDAALSLWRGPTLAGLQLESLGRDEVARLDELRLSALMDRIDCDLALDRQEQVLGELSVLVREHPLRERLRAQQVLALYRADRQADALAAYADARKTLVDDLGIEPSEGLQRLQQAILRHDASLETPTGTAAVNGLAPDARSSAAPPEPLEQRRRRGFRPRRWQVVVTGLILLAGSATAAAILSSSASATLKIIPDSLVELNPRTGKPIAMARVGLDPGTIAVTPTAIWTANAGDNTVSRYDLRTHTVQPRAGYPGMPSDVAVDGDGNAWITSSGHGTPGFPPRNAFVTRLEAGPGGTSTGALYPSHVQTIGLPLPMAGFETLGGGYLWVIVGGHGPNPGDDRVALVDLSNHQLASVIHLHESATAIAFGYGSAWIGTYNYGSAMRVEAIRAGDSKPTTVVLEKHAVWGPLWIAVGAGAVWALTSDALFQIDPQTLQVLHRLDFSVPQNGALAVGAGAVWVINDYSPGHPRDTLTEIDPHTDQIIRTSTLGDRAQLPNSYIAATRSAVWVTFGDSRPCCVGR
jgi:DNA-binding SARP family transcriptional activator